MDNVQTDTSAPVVLDMDNIEDAILARWEDPETVSEDDQEATSEIEEETIDDEGEEVEIDQEDDEAEMDPEEADDEDEDDEEEVEEDDDEEEVTQITDDTEVEILVDGETQTASIKDLKRLYGQEASLTRKSQEVASKRKEADDTIQKSQVVFDKLLKQAQERYKPYQDVDMLVASKTMSSEDFTQLRKEAAEAYQDLQFLSEEADSYFGDLQQQQDAALKQAAQDCVKTLQEEIPDWSNAMYNDIRTYAIGLGLPEEQVNQYVDPIVIQLINKARLYDQGKQVATVKKKQSSQKKVLRSKKSPPSDQAKRRAAKAKQMEALRNTRDIDDLADVILSRWEA